MKTVKIFEILEIVGDDLKKHYYYRGGELDGQPFHTEIKSGGVVMPAKSPEDIRNEEKMRKLLKVSSVGNVIKSHKDQSQDVSQVRKRESDN